MTNAQKYDRIFILNLKVTKEDLPGLKYHGIKQWDSMRHIDLVTDLYDPAGYRGHARSVVL